MIVRARYDNERYSILVGNLYYLSFFGGEDIDMAVDRVPIRNRWGLAWGRKD